MVMSGSNNDSVGIVASFIIDRGISCPVTDLYFNKKTEKSSL